MFYADLHIHSRHSFATSRDLDLDSIASHADRKGVGVVGTGDFTHPGWMAELESRLRPAEPGLFRIEPGSRRARFLLQTELCTIYRQEGRTRRVHHLVCVPCLDSARRLAGRIAPYGRLDANARPVLRLDSRSLLELVLDCGPGCVLIPAHIWTPWYSALGSRSGFDAIEECYRDLAGSVFAVETGLSSDPAMNRRVSLLDRFALVSGSDAHSPSRIGREATRFGTGLSYPAIMEALRTGHGYGGTVELFPEEGKYYLDGCRRCGIGRRPREHDGRCPSCGRSLTLGVLHRVERLSDREEPSSGEGYESFVSLSSIVAEMTGKGCRSQRVRSLCSHVVSTVGPELEVLGRASVSALEKAGIPYLAEALVRMRARSVSSDPGYDGQCGTISLFAPPELERVRSALERVRVKDAATGR